MLLQTLRSTHTNHGRRDNVQEQGVRVTAPLSDLHGQGREAHDDPARDLEVELRGAEHGVGDGVAERAEFGANCFEGFECVFALIDHVGEEEWVVLENCCCCLFTIVIIDDRILSVVCDDPSEACDELFHCLAICLIIFWCDSSHDLEILCCGDDIW